MNPNRLKDLEQRILLYKAHISQLAAVKSSVQSGKVSGKTDRLLFKCFVPSNRPLCAQLSHSGSLASPACDMYLVGR